jgi:uncharacterized membrane protein YtjA (UPF0391 family)
MEVTLCWGREKRGKSRRAKGNFYKLKSTAIALKLATPILGNINLLIFNGLWILAWLLQFGNWMTSLQQQVFWRLEVNTMSRWATVFLVLAAISGLLSFTGVVGVGSDAAQNLFLVFIVMFLAAMVARTFHDDPPNTGMS